MSDETVIRAPWTGEQVDSLNGYQQSGVFHPFTCGPCRETLGIYFKRNGDGTLDPLPIGSVPDPEWAALAAANLIEVEDHLLVATPGGWVCPTCDYTQDWAHSWMADGTWLRAWRWRQPQ